MSSVRYIFNTSGEYAGFVIGDNLFTETGDWIGVLRDGNLVFGKDGQYLGSLTEDDRVIRHTQVLSPPRIPRPMRPLRPLRPMRPLRRLRMPSLPFGYEDVFLGKSAPLASENLSDLNRLLESKLIAHDGTPLGNVTRNRFDSESVLNQFGPYGSRYTQTSIFNPYSPYGSPYSPLSPFNPYSTTPPYFLKGGMKLAFLTKNQFVQPGVDPERFQEWLGLA